MIHNIAYILFFIVDIIFYGYNLLYRKKDIKSVNKINAIILILLLTLALIVLNTKETNISHSIFMAYLFAHPIIYFIFIFIAYRKD